MERHPSSIALGDILLTALAPIIWGSTYIVTSELLPPDRPFTAAFIRVFPAGLLLVLLIRRWPGAWNGALPPCWPCGPVFLASLAWRFCCYRPWRRHRWGC